LIRPLFIRQIHAPWRGSDDTGRDVAGGTYFAVLVLDGVRTDTMAKMTLVK